MSFFKAIGNFFKHLFGSSSWEHVASATLLVISPLLQTIVTATAGSEDAAAVAAIVAKIQQALAAVSALIDGIHSQQVPPDVVSNITNILNNVKANLAELLAAGQIKNPETLAKVTTYTNTAISEIEAILQVLPKQS